MRLLQQQEAEDEREERDRFDDADDDEEVRRALAGLAERVGARRGDLALEEPPKRRICF